ncbi:MAG: protein SCO1/2 [Flavobacteriaceae bacterium]|jgi:protein SCO1/2
MKNKHFYILLILGLFSCSQETSNQEVKDETDDRIPYYVDASFTPVWMTGEEAEASDIHRIPDFSFTNQDGEEVSNQSLEGKIFIVDYFFTTCPGICAKMTKNMVPVQSEFMKDEDVVILSHSVTPLKDSVPILKNYALANNVHSGKWHLLTGDKKALYDLGRKSYFIEESQGLERTEDEFLHTENFVIIDKDRRIRGIYNGLSKASVQQMINDIRILQKEG